MTSSDLSLLIVGNPEATHVGAHFRRGAEALQLRADFVDVRSAYAGPAWKRRLNWWGRGHRPARLTEFNTALRELITARRPQRLLTTGLAPVDRQTLDLARRLGVSTVNFLTDDPWNPVHRAGWFFDALPGYSHVFSPRQANLGDLAKLCPDSAIGYLQFAYSPDVHFPEPCTEAERHLYTADVMFAGGADTDRRALLGTFIRAGLRVSLYGGYWTRHPQTRGAARGHLDAAGLRKATTEAAVCLCLVRRANRDGHAMRSFEAPAMRGCLLVEDTADHRRLFGPEGAAALYFGTAEEAVAKARVLLADADRRQAMAAEGRAVVTSGGHTYADRLRSILERVRDVAA